LKAKVLLTIAQKIYRGRETSQQRQRKHDSRIYFYYLMASVNGEFLQWSGGGRRERGDVAIRRPASPVSVRFSILGRGHRTLP
jgi:hypothetical protein